MTQPKYRQIDSSRIVDSVIQRLLENRSLFETFLRRQVPDDFLAQDLLQQSFLKAVQQQRSMNNKESVVPWFYRILRNTVIDYYRSSALENTRWNDFLNESRVLTDDHTPSLDEIKPTVCPCLDGVISALRPAYADLIRRVDLEGAPLPDVARDLQITLNNATVRLHRARQALRASLENFCGVCSKHGCLNCTCETP